jgi:hypothetical protein
MFSYQAMRLLRRWWMPRLAESFDLVRRARFCTRRLAPWRLYRSGGVLRPPNSPFAYSPSKSSRHAGVI